MRFFSSLLLSVTSFTALSSAAPLEETSSNLSRRGADFSTYGDWTGSTSSYPDGSGQYVRSDDDHHYASRVHCWTDLFYVDHSYEAHAWKRSDTSIDCATTQTCASGQVNSAQQCVTWTLGGQISFDVVKGLSAISNLGGGFNFQASGEQQWCTAAMSQNTCTWNDKGCHALWTSDVVMVSKGYVRRRCSGNNGDYTAWSHDYQISLPDSITRIGCAAACDATTYPGGVPLPPNN